MEINKALKTLIKQELCRFPSSFVSLQCWYYMPVNNVKLLSILPAPRAHPLFCPQKKSSYGTKHIIWQILGLLYQQHIANLHFCFARIQGRKENTWIQRERVALLSLLNRVRGCLTKL